MDNSFHYHDQNLLLNNSEMANMNQHKVFNTPGCSVSNNQQPVPYSPGNGMPTNHLMISNGFPSTPLSHNTSVIGTPHSTAVFPDLGYYSASSSHSHWSPQSLNFSQHSDISSPSSSSSTPPFIDSFPIVPPLKFGSYNPGRILPVNKDIRKKTTSEKSTMWFFLLELLTDRTKKSVIAWTGNGKEFRIFNFKVLTALWSEDKRSTDVNTVKKNIRNCCRDRILRVTNVKLWTYEFITEPSIHLKNTTRKMLDIYIALNHINGPLTTGTPIDFPLPSRRFPKGKRLRVDRLVPLRNDGSPVEESHEEEYCVVDLVEDDFEQ